MPKGPTIPTPGSSSAASSGPNTSPTGSTEPSATTTVRPRVRFNPAFLAAPQPVPASSQTTSTRSPQATGLRSLADDRPRDRDVGLQPVAARLVYDRPAGRRDPVPDRIGLREVPGGAGRGPL